MIGIDRRLVATNWTWTNKPRIILEHSGSANRMIYDRSSFGDWRSCILLLFSIESIELLLSAAANKLCSNETQIAQSNARKNDSLKMIQYIIIEVWSFHQSSFDKQINVRVWQFQLGLFVCVIFLWKNLHTILHLYVAWSYCTKS